MDTSDPEITFDKNGICNHCTEFIDAGKAQVSGDEQRRNLERMIVAIKVPAAASD